MKFNFYSYDALGRDVVIVIEAKDEDAAWDEFDFIYGPDTIVDQVIKA